MTRSTFTMGWNIQSLKMILWLQMKLLQTKMDIEGSDFAVLGHMIDTETANMVNYFFGEWHPVPQFIYQGQQQQYT